MALISCPDCQGKVSDAAPACIHCGAPLKGAATATTPGTPQAPKKMGFFAKTVLWLGGGFIAFMVIGLMNADPQRDAAQLAERKQACARAMMSSMGTSTTGYADKAAYDARVRKACDGLEINGQDLGRVGR
jgi:hypothetical protein